MSTMFENMGIDLGIVVIFLMLIVIILIVITMKLHMGMNRLNKKYRLFMRGKDAESLERIFQKKFIQLDKMEQVDENHAASIAALKHVQDNTLNKYGVVKYDAFDDVGGKLSFALALLNTADTGIVLNAIHSKENCFLYVKEIVNGESYIMLSDEEIEALRIAKRYGEIENNENIM